MSVIAAETNVAVRRSAWRQDLDTVRVLWRRDLMRFLRQPSRIVGALGQPVIFWGVLGSGMASTFRLPGSELGYLEYFFPGVVTMVVLFASIFSTLSVIEDRHQGFLQTVLVSPGSRAAVVAGKCLGAATVALIQAALFLALSPLAGFPLAQTSWPQVFAALLLMSLSLCALGVALAWWLDNVQAFHAIQMTLLVPLWGVSGAMFPAPESSVFQTVMRANPLAYAVEAVRRAMYGGQIPDGVPQLAGAFTGFAVLIGAAALSLWAAVAVVGRRR